MEGMGEWVISGICDVKRETIKRAKVLRMLEHGSHRGEVASNLASSFSAKAKTTKSYSPF